MGHSLSCVRYITSNNSWRLRLNKPFEQKWYFHRSLETWNFWITSMVILVYMYKTWPLACQQQVPTELEQKILFKWESALWCSELRLRMRFQPKSWLSSVPAAGELLSVGKRMGQWMHTLTQLMKEESLLFLLPGHTSTGGCSGPQTCALHRERTVTLTCLPFIEVSA